jgi:hypothetical protein
MNDEKDLNMKVVTETRGAYDIYKEALYIMGNDLANKYVSYVQKKQHIQKRGKVAFSDSSRNKCYTAEFSALRRFRAEGGVVEELNAKKTDAYFKKVAKSKTYKDLCYNTEGSTHGHTDPTLLIKNFGGRTAGTANSCGVMRLQDTNSEYTIIHEFAHLCGNMHHDIGFRRDVIKLSSRFLGTKFAKILKEEFKKAKLKVTISQNIKTAEQWLIDYRKMEIIRNKKEK